MKPVHLFLFLVGLSSLFAASSLAADSELARSRRMLRDAPSDIVALAERAIGCRRLATVEVKDEASDARVEAAFKIYRCDTLEADVASLRRKYARQEVMPVEVDLDGLNKLGVELVTANLLQQAATVRHDPETVAAVAMRLAAKGRRRRQNETRRHLWKRN